MQAGQPLDMRTHGAGLHGAGAAGGGEQGAGGKGGGAGAALLQVPQPAAQHEALVRRQAPAHGSRTVRGAAELHCRLEMHAIHMVAVQMGKIATCQNSEAPLGPRSRAASTRRCPVAGVAAFRKALVQQPPRICRVLQPTVGYLVTHRHRRSPKQTARWCGRGWQARLASSCQRRCPTHSKQQVMQYKHACSKWKHEKQEVAMMASCSWPP